jgi:hydrogenase expression/formation protein HypE
MGLDGALSSDCAVLTPLIQTLRPLRGVKALRDATRGGVNAVAHEFAAASGCGIELHEASCRSTTPCAASASCLGWTP